MTPEFPPVKLKLTEPEQFGNVAELFDETERRRMATWLIELIAIDDQSMSEWRTEAEGYLDELENGNTAEPQNKEQKGSNEDQESPSTRMTLAAVIQFSARATDALLSEPDLVKASEDDPDAAALAAWMSSQLRTDDRNWVADTDPLVIHMSVTGLAWRKRDFDTFDKAFHSEFLTVGEVIINANVKGVERAPRITHQFERYPYEIERAISRKKWVDFDPLYNEADPQAPKKFYETDCYLDLDGDGTDEPWTVTISRDDTPEVVRIAPRWTKKTVVDSDEELFFKSFPRFFPYKFLPDPKGGFLPKGFGWLLNKVEKSADRLLASIDDTAKSEAENGGVYGGSGMAMPDKVELKGNRMTFIPTDGAPLTNSVQMWPAKQVSPGSVQVLEKIMTLGDRLAGTLNLLENAPASMTATLAKGIIDTGSQVQSAVHRRLVSDMTMEFRSFAAMANAYDALPDGVQASEADGIEVTADPQLATEMHRSALANVYMELLKDPGTNPQEVRLRLYRTLRLPNPEKLLGSMKKPEATPQEQAETAIAMQKEQTARKKVDGANILAMTQALKTLVEAGQGVVDIQAAIAQMSQLEQAVQAMTDDNATAGSGSTGMAGQPGNGGAAPPNPAPEGGNGGGVPIGAAGGAGATGFGGGAAPT